MISTVTKVYIDLVSFSNQTLRDCFNLYNNFFNLNTFFYVFLVLYILVQNLCKLSKIILIVKTLFSSQIVTTVNLSL